MSLILEDDSPLGDPQKLAERLVKQMEPANKDPVEIVGYGPSKHEGVTPRSSAWKKQNRGF